MTQVADLVSKYPSIEIYGDGPVSEYYLIDSRVHGLFACMYCILYGLFICEQEGVDPIIHLGDNHLYYEKKYGENIFNYFFIQKNIETKGVPRIKVQDPEVFLSWCNISMMEKRVSNYLIDKYFKLKPAYKQIIESYVQAHFSGHRVLGVHYRGKDKITETAIVPIDEYAAKIDYLLESGICDKIFFATDELHLRAEVQKKYKERVIVYQLEGDYSAIRPDSNKGLHYSSATPFLHAKDAIIECYLLSKCQMLLSSSKSSMSLFSTFINPEIAHIVMEP